LENNDSITFVLTNSFFLDGPVRQGAEKKIKELKRENEVREEIFCE
jgi:hypothetical protein